MEGNPKVHAEADSVMEEMMYGLSELEESSLNRAGGAVTQDGFPIVILEDTVTMDRFTVVVMPGDVREKGKGDGG